MRLSCLVPVVVPTRSDGRCPEAGFEAGGPRNTSRVGDSSEPCCEVARTPPSSRALFWSFQYVREGARTCHKVGPDAPPDPLPGILLAILTVDCDTGLSVGPAVCGKTATTFPVACIFFSSRHTVIWSASRTDSPCQSRACPEYTTCPEDVEPERASAVM